MIEVVDKTESIAVENQDEVHVYPDFEGEPEHSLSMECWCMPRRDDDEPLLIIHGRGAFS